MSTTLALLLCLAGIVALNLDKLQMLAVFLFSDEKEEDRQLQWLHLKLRFLKAVAREIGQTEDEIKGRGGK